MTLLLPSVHPHISEPVITDTGFTIEMWTDYLLPASALTSFRAAAAAIPQQDGVCGQALLHSRVTVERNVLWVCVTAAGPGVPDDAIWADTEDRFRRLWADIHEQAQVAG